MKKNLFFLVMACIGMLFIGCKPEQQTGGETQIKSITIKNTTCQGTVDNTAFTVLFDAVPAETPVEALQFDARCSLGAALNQKEYDFTKGASEDGKELVGTIKVVNGDNSQEYTVTIKLADPVENPKLAKLVMKKADGTWWFDYTVFDKWVEFMMECGVKKEINCYSMVPWRLSFQYFDQASNTFKYFNGKPGEPAYEEFWMRMLTSFAQHLKEKGWFEITHIAMDERGLKDMLATIEVVRKADPDFKLSLAGTYHKELLEDLDDYCITLAEEFTPEELKKRKAEGKVTTFYTCCTEARPNTFTFSPLAESEWLGWWAAKINVDGYLRWALNSWVKDPLLDSRFISWAAGDCYLLYPGGRTSARFERLIEGIQAYEKIRILRNEKDKKGRKKNYGKQIDNILESFNPYNLLEVPAEKVVNKAKAALNKF